MGDSTMIDMNTVNKDVFELACKLHGLEIGDTRALASYEMIKQFLVDHDFMVEATS